MTFDTIIADITRKKFQPIYFLFGEEAYYIDLIEQHILETALAPHEKDFNLDIFYAKDIDGQTIINVAGQYPSFAERRVVLVREAQDFKVKTWEELEKYFLKPAHSTVLVFCHKHKALDKRTKIAKTIEKNSVFFNAEKIKEEKLPQWIEQFVKKQNLAIAASEAQLLAENLGNDLSKISNEIEKLKVVLAPQSPVTKDVIEKWIGISKEYNLTEMNKAIVHHDFSKAIKIALYFEKNPKAGSIIGIVAYMYQFFSRLLIYHANKSKSESELRNMGLFFLQDYKTGIKYYSNAKTTDIIHLLNEFDAKSKGLYAGSNSSHSDLLRELVYKIMH
jgi:DNA polymerase-3 subunit delta